jgi:hypothetical protein
LAELSALAEGTLDPERADAVRRRIASSPELSERYEQERRAVQALHALRADRAPASLRIRVDERQRAPRRRPSLLYGGALAAATAVIVAAVVLLLPGGTPGSPSVSQAAGLALRGPAFAAPPPMGSRPGGKLGQDVEEVYFPDWSRSLGWVAQGQRIDHLSGRLTKTVYYERAGKQVAYTILAAPALRWPAGHAFRLASTEFRSFTDRGRLVVTWRRAGHTCVLSGRGVPARQLARLASWG